MPLIKTVNQSLPDSGLIMMAAEALKSGGIVVVPTETRYGMAVRIDDSSCLEHLYQVKKRRPDHPTAVFVRSHEEINHFGMVNRMAARLVDTFLPGPMTLVIPAKSGYNPPLTVENKIGIRYSSSKVIAQLLDNVQFNFTATSANISGQGDPASIAEIVALFDDEVDFYLDAGPLEALSSTVIDCTEKEIKILRDGAITEEQIKLALGES
jgi:L-threonylcarbamoyladenylate synthase